MIEPEPVVHELSYQHGTATRRGYPVSMILAITSLTAVLSCYGAEFVLGKDRWFVLALIAMCLMPLGLVAAGAGVVVGWRAFRKRTGSPAERNALLLNVAAILLAIVYLGWQA